MPALLSEPNLATPIEWSCIENSIRNWPTGKLIEADEERRFFLSIEACQQAAEDAHSNNNLFDASLWSERATIIRNHVISQSMRLVFSLAGKFAGSLCSRDDLISEGGLALMRAAKAFNVHRGFRFSTYATHAIRNGLVRCIKQRQRLNQHEPSAYESNELVESNPSISTQAASQRYVGLNRILSRLGDRDRLIIKSRFGLGDELSESTLQRLADRLKISRERVRQLEIRALCRLREYADEEGFEPL